MERPNINDIVTIKISHRRQRGDLTTGKYTVKVTDMSSWYGCFWAKHLRQDGSTYGIDVLFAVDEIVKEKRKK
jgi:hypothetical protein